MTTARHEVKYKKNSFMFSRTRNEERECNDSILKY